MDSDKLAEWLAQEHELVVRVVTGSNMATHRMAMPDCPVCAAIGTEALDTWHSQRLAHGGTHATAH